MQDNVVVKLKESIGRIIAAIQIDQIYKESIGRIIAAIQIDQI